MMEELDTDEYIRRIKALNAIKDQYEFTTSIQVTCLYDDETLQLTLLEISVTSGHHPSITDQCRILQPFIVFKARISPDLLLWNFLREEEFSNEADTFIRWRALLSNHKHSSYLLSPGSWKQSNLGTNLDTHRFSLETRSSTSSPQQNCSILWRPRISPFLTS